MSKLDLEKLAWMLDADPDVIATEPLDQVRRDLIGAGIDLEALGERVGAIVRRWLEAVQTERKLQMPSGSSLESIRAARRSGVVARAVVEPWVSPLVHMAFPVPHRSRVRQLIARVDELRSLRVEPHLRIDIKRMRGAWSLIFALEPIAYPKPGQLLKPKAGEVEVHLLCAGEERAVALVSSSRLLQSIPLPDYVPDEECAWEVKVSVRVDSRTPR